MKNLHILVTVALALVVGALCGPARVGAAMASMVDQGAPGKQGPWPVTIAGGGSSSTAYAPDVPVNVNLSANVSGAATGLTAGACFQISCGAAAQFRVGTSTPTAVSTDNDLPPNTILRLCLTNSETAFAFVSASATTCKVANTPLVP